MLKVVVGIDIVNRIVETINGEDISPEINLENILSAVSHVLNIPVLDIRSKSRKREFTDARKYYCILAKTYTGMTLNNIGRLVNYKHDVVIYSNNLSEHLLSYDLRFRHEYNLIKERLNLK